MRHRTLFLVRPSIEGPLIDAVIKWREPHPDWKDILAVEEVAARLQGVEFDFVAEISKRWPDAMLAAAQYRTLELRARYNNMEGPFLVVTHSAPTDVELLTWFKHSTPEERNAAKKLRQPSKENQ